MCAELVNAILTDNPYGWEDSLYESANRARVLLDQPEPAIPVKQQIFPTPSQAAECGGPCYEGSYCPEACDCGLCRSPTPQPVAVAPYREVADLVVWLEDHSAECLELDQPEWSQSISQAARFLHLYLKDTPQPPADVEAAELAAELRHFVAEYQQMRGLDPESIYSIHQGDAEKEAHLRISRLTRIADLLERPTPR